MKQLLLVSWLTISVFACGNDVGEPEEEAATEQAEAAFTVAPELVVAEATVTDVGGTGSSDETAPTGSTLSFDDEGLGDLGLNVFSLQEVVDLLRYADAAYVRVSDLVPGPVESPESKKLLLIDSIQKQGHRVIFFGNDCQFKGIFVIQNDGSVVIAYRGTIDWSDIQADMNAFLVTSRWAAGRVHRGFYKEFESTWDGIYTNLFEHAKSLNKRVQDLDIRIVGHSLGGALATLAAYRHAKVSEANNVRLLTFGSPRVLDSVAAADFEQTKELRALRVCQHHQDPVCAVVLGAFGYSHVGYYTRVEAQQFNQIHVLSGYAAAMDGLKALPLPNNYPSFGAYVYADPPNKLERIRRSLNAIPGAIQVAFGKWRRSYFGSNALIERTLK